MSTGTDKNNGAPKASGRRQVYNGLKNSEAVFELASRINAERAEREAAKLLEESMKTTTVNSLHAVKIDAPKTFNDLQTIGELNNITAIKNFKAPKAYDGPQDFDMVKEIAASVNAQVVDGENNTVVKTPDAPKTLVESKSLNATKTSNAPQNIGERKNLTGAKNLNERQGYKGPRDFDAVNEAAARIQAQDNASMSLHEPMSPTVVKTLEAPNILAESKSLNTDKSLNGSVHAPKSLNERKNLTGTKDINERKGYNGPRDFDIVKEAAARVHAQSNAPKNLAEPMSLSTGTNPKAQAFVPASRALGSNPGLASPEDFMAHARDFFSNGGLGSVRSGRSTTAREPPARVLLFKDVPDWMTLSDAIALVYGGAIDSIFRSEMAEITVQFCDEAACKAYLEAYPNGIKVANPGNPTEEVTINVEKATRGQEISPALQVKIGSGGSRLICIDGMLDAATIQALTVRAWEYEVEHVEFRAEKNKVRSRVY